MSKKSAELTAPKQRSVAYYRVSSKRQGTSGLGLEAQQSAVEAFLKGPPDHAFTEVESGRKDKRPELARALACCNATKARLVIAKLDRLSRNAAFLFNLMESKVSFVCCDMPQADNFTIGILACVAQKESEMASIRTREALAAAKRRGVKLGNPRPAKSIKRAHAAKQVNARAFVAKFGPILAKVAKHGATTLQEKADALNRLGYTTRNGKQKFYPSTVRALKLAAGTK